MRRNICLGLAIALLLSVAASQGAAAQTRAVIRCTWMTKPFKSSKSEPLVQCSINPPVVKRLTRAFADRLFAKGARLYATNLYGPRLHLPVSAPDHCRIGQRGIADCEGEFARVGQVFPKCAQWFQIWLVGLHKALPGSRALIMTTLTKPCHDPAYVAALIPGP